VNRHSSRRHCEGAGLEGQRPDRLIQMLSNTTSRTLLRFLVDEFSCVGRTTALKIIELARKQSDRRLSDRSYPKHIAHAQATALHRAIQKTRILAPRTDCIVPIGEKQLLEGLHKELEADFFTVTTRPAAAYRAPSRRFAGRRPAYPRSCRAEDD
jgi:DNA topoisomerase-6 subunit B